MHIGWIKPTLVVPVIYVDGEVSHLAYTSKWLYNNRYNFNYSFEGHLITPEGATVTIYFKIDSLFSGYVDDEVEYITALNDGAFIFDNDGKFVDESGEEPH